MPFFPIPGVWTTGQELEEVRGGNLLRSAKSEVWHRCLPGRAKEWLPGFPIQEQLYSNTKEAEGFLLVQRTPRQTLPRCSREGLEEGEDGTRSYHCCRQ